MPPVSNNVLHTEKDVKGIDLTLSVFTTIKERKHMVIMTGRADVSKGDDYLCTTVAQWSSTVGVKDVYRALLRKHDSSI